jgi:hypothetical protein
MSSIQEKNGNVKKAFLLRSASLEKIKCSAYQIGKKNAEKVKTKKFLA